MTTKKQTKEQTADASHNRDQNLADELLRDVADGKGWDEERWAKRGLQAQGKPELPQIHSWLWPDHTIGKRESRQLREEHNRLINHAEALAEALRGIMDAYCRNAEKTVAEIGEHALQSDVRRARQTLAAWEATR